MNLIFTAPDDLTEADLATVDHTVKDELLQVKGELDTVVILGSDTDTTLAEIVRDSINFWDDEIRPDVRVSDESDLTNPENLLIVFSRGETNRAEDWIEKAEENGLDVGIVPVGELAEKTVSEDFTPEAEL